MLRLVRDREKRIPEGAWLTDALWGRVTQKLPIACVDLILERKDGSVLYGYRKISPYKNVWALIGGRMFTREGLGEASIRISREYGISIVPEALYLVGVFPVSFAQRSDVAVAIAAPGTTGDHPVGSVEFSKMMWSKSPPVKIGANYRRMVNKWVAARSNVEFLRLSRIS